MTAPTGEFAFIDWLRRRTPADPRVLLGPGDDTAALSLSPGTPTLVTTDMLLEGSCFVLDEAGPRRVGRKAMAVNLSDIAAMAGRPVAAVVSVALPRRGGQELAEQLYLGMRQLADEWALAKGRIVRLSEDENPPEEVRDRWLRRMVLTSPRPRSGSAR